jgi:hypothetical protein
MGVMRMATLPPARRAADRAIQEVDHVPGLVLADLPLGFRMGGCRGKGG